MDTNEEPLLQRMVETIIREVAPETIILFGSRARAMRGLIPTWICWWWKVSRFRPSAAAAKKLRACI